MHVEPDNPYSGFLIQFRRARVIKKVSISFENIFLPHFTAVEVLNATSTSTSSVDH